MTDLSGEVVAGIHDHLQRARSAAAAIEDPSTRRAVESLAAATAELLKAVRDPAR